jgi:hypothetical protein
MCERRRRETPREVWGHAPQEIFKFWTSETPFAALWEQLQQKINLMKWDTIIAIFSLTDSHNSLLREN